MEPKRDFIETALSTVNSLLPMNAETRHLINWLDEPGRMSKLRRLSAETGEDEPVEAFLEAIARELEDEAIPMFDDKIMRHQINWDQVEKHVRKSESK